ncbi:putative GTD-binding domain-containing protein [Helianthus annuus]|nr:putative GTD-binding domain-containing protein [Helianthus annuus]
MDSESTSVVKCCDCGCSYCDPRSSGYSTTWLRSVKRKLDELEQEDGGKFVIPGFVIPSVARVDIENECNVLREMVTNQQRTIEDLISDLEEERYASASAANEAMSMILKLQREKAEVEMEARQFKRFSEEKMDHDQQELMALEELLYRREQSIQSLTCEVQAYKRRMISFGLMEAEADGENQFLTRENSVATNLESRFGFDFASYDYPRLKCNNSNGNREYPDHENETVDVEKYAFSETPHSLKDIEERINQLERSPGQSQSQSQPVLEKVIVGYSLMKKHSKRLSSESADPFSDMVKEDLVPDSSRVVNETVSESRDETSDRIYTIDSVHNVNDDQKGNIGTYDDSFMSSPEGSTFHDEIEDPEVKKLYARLHALEADRESMRQTLIAMRTDKAQLVLLKEIAQHLCKDMSPPGKIYVKKPDNGAGLSFFAVFKWITSFGYLRRAQRNKHMFSAMSNSPGVLMLLDEGHQRGQWRCLSSTQV